MWSEGIHDTLAPRQAGRRSMASLARQPFRAFYSPCVQEPGFMKIKDIIMQMKDTLPPCSAP